MYCNECRFFTDQGRCKNPATRRSDVGYFQAACNQFEPMEKIEKETPVEVAQEPKKAEGTKECEACGKTLPLSKFARYRWGYRNYCKDCAKERRKDYKAQSRYGAPQAPTQVWNPINDVSDQTLIDALKSRGWSGTLTKTISCEL